MKKANIETYGKNVKFQSLRKFLYDVLARMDETVACVITAKKTDASKITYRTSLDSECERIYRESYKLFALNGDVSGKAKKEQAEQIARLENALSHVESENLAFKVRVDNLQKTTKSLEDRLSNLTDLLSEQVEFFWNCSEEEKEALRRKYGLRKYSEEYKEIYRAFNAMTMELQKEKGYLDEKDVKELKRQLKTILEKENKS